MEKNKLVFKILNLSGIIIEDLNNLDGLVISRDILLDYGKYEKIKEYLINLREENDFSSSTLTCLHNGADIKQKWPLLNLVRQILKVKNFRMVPIRKSDGKDNKGKKKYKRFFRIEKYKTVVQEVISES